MNLNKKNIDIIINCYKNMYSSRQIDNIELELVNNGKANFLTSSKGHEGSVIFSEFLKDHDWLHCHYRDKPVMFSRGMKAKMFFYSSLCKAESISHGRQMRRIRFLQSKVAKWPTTIQHLFLKVLLCFCLLA